MTWFKSSTRRAEPTSEPPPAPREPATVADIMLAYRLLLKREADPQGLAHYSERIAQGLTVEDVIQELLSSEERAARLKGNGNSNAKPTGSAPLRRADYIDPKEVIRKFSVEELNRTSDEYFQRLQSPEVSLRKPFANVDDAPAMLENLGALLSGLRLGQAMTVLDFGAGTCWLTRLLAQMKCAMIACDPSATALALGRRFFEEHPPLGGEILPPRFLQFDGYRIDLPDHSVERIICFDAFHHVPNQSDVIREFGRVLRPGGIAGFSEPGRYHSHSLDSQTEMRKFAVLENDIDLNEIFSFAQASGFTRLSVRVQNDLEISLEQYNALLDPADANLELRTSAWGRMHDTMLNRSVFFLHKGEFRPDSRSEVGLAHRISVTPETLVGPAPTLPITLDVTMTNTGDARWVGQATDIFGQVRLGCHLHDINGAVVDGDYFRAGLPPVVESGETIRMTISLPAPALRPCLLVFDMVAEGVTWFEDKGSTPVVVRVD